MPVENYNEYRENPFESMKTDFNKEIIHSKLNNLESEILSKKVDFKIPDNINHLYRLELWKPVFQLYQTKDYLEKVYKKLSWTDGEKSIQNKQKYDFTETILAIQIVLKSMESDPKNSKKYNVGKISGEYNDNTQKAIIQFQIDNRIEHNWKPNKNTILKLINKLDELIKNRKEYERIKNIIKNSWRYYNEQSLKSMTDYIIKWNLWTNKNPIIERQINNSVSIKTPFNKDLQDLVKEKKVNNEYIKLNILNKDQRFNNTKYDNLIIQFCKKYSDKRHVDPALIKILMYKESKFDPKARSGAWAKWLMQLMPIAVKEVNKTNKIINNVYDPKQNIEGGIKLFSGHLNTFKWNIPLALAAYNAGAGSVKKAWNKIPNNKETKDYVRFITNEYKKLKA